MATVHVVFVDASRGSVFAETDLALDQLPETFELDTTMHLGGQDWQVETADPMTRDDIARAGALRLTLRRVVNVSPQDILFTLPTIENVLPPLRAPEPGDLAGLVLHEDDWRQVELVARRFEVEILAELDDIRAVRAERKGAGFARIHIRRRLPAPLADVELVVAEVQAVAGARLAGLRLGGGVVDGGFTFAGDRVTLYGRADADGAVVELCATGELGSLAPFAMTHGLLIVDWCAARVL